MAQWWRTRLPAQEMRVQSLGWEDPLEEMATHSSILAWEILCTEEPGGLQSMGSPKNQTQWGTSHLTHTHARAHTHTHTCTHTYLPLDQFPLDFPTSRLQLDQQRLKGSWYHLDHSRVRRPCGALCGTASSFVIFTVSVCVATWSVFPTLSGWQTRFARGQDHQPLECLTQKSRLVNKQVKMNTSFPLQHFTKWWGRSLSLFLESHLCLHPAFLFCIPALSHLCALSQMPFLFEPYASAVPVRALFILLWLLVTVSLYCRAGSSNSRISYCLMPLLCLF